MICNGDHTNLTFFVSCVYSNKTVTSPDYMLLLLYFEPESGFRSCDIVKLKFQCQEIH
jgi:hypothetical protein